MSESDPLLAGSKKKIEDHEAGREAITEPIGKTILHATLLAIAPWLTFLLVIFTMWEMWHGWTKLAMVIIAGVLCLNISFAIFELAHGKAWLWWFGVLCAIGILAGIAAGTFNYYRYLLYYWSYHDLRKYTNVPASQHAAGFADAGMILFTKDSAVDTTGAVGFQDAASAGTVYCVAPIADASMTKNDLVSYFAVGENCCEERANFACDGAGDGGAKSGLVLLDVAKLISPTVAYFVADNQTANAYANAMRLQSAVFGTGNAKETVLVRWTKDPVALQDQYWNKAFSMATYETGVYFVFCLFMGTSAAFRCRPKVKLMST